MSGHSGRIEFPALLEAAEEKSSSAQKQFTVFSGVQLGLLFLVPVFSLIDAGWMGNFGPVATLMAALGSLAIQLSGVVVKAERRWYDARAAAESVKAASWEFSVGGEAFRLGDASAEKRFASLMQKILDGLRHFDVPYNTSEAVGSVTSGMKGIRSMSLEDRVETYKTFRVDDQLSWYTDKSRLNRRRNRQFVVLASALQILAVFLGICRIEGAVEADLMGVCATAVASVIGWGQAKKYANLSEVYAVTSHEVNQVATSVMNAGTEADWSQAVHDAEAAFSREHTMWLARRQGPT